MPTKPLTSEEFEKRLRRARISATHENNFSLPTEKRSFGLKKPAKKRKKTIQAEVL